ncbi:MAG: acetyltransferase [Bryobacteraceae bacterium]
MDRAAMPVVLVLILGAPAAAQLPMGATGSRVRVQNTDLAVLEAGENRNDLPCSVTQDKPFLGFDLRFHAGYDVTVPLRELSGSENLLSVLFRVASKDHPDDIRYFTQKIRVPSIEEEAKGDAVLQGGFDLGEGNYHVDWLMRDRSERVCSHSWDVEASLPNKDKQMNLMIGTGAIEPIHPEQFHDEPPVERSSEGKPLTVKILMNFAPQKPTAATLRPIDTVALVSMLRTLTRDPRIGKFSLVAFNLRDQKILYRQENADRIDFKALGESLKEVTPGAIDLKLLGKKHGETDFLAELIAKETVVSAKPDAMVFAGPKALLDQGIPEDKLRQIGEVEFPMFYLNYILNPQATPWRDTIGNAVKFFKGTEFTISRPRDLWYSISEMVTRIVKFRNGKQIASVSTGER